MLYTLFIATAYADKVTVCHIPPSNPANFHDITINEKALQAHLNHGDFLGSCSAHCAALCDDGDACTQDYVTENGECVCLDGHPPVDCDDSNPCTADSCDTTDGCEYDSTALNDIACDDGNLATVNEICVEGVCEGTPRPCPCITIPAFITHLNNLTPTNVCIDSLDAYPNVSVITAPTQDLPMVATGYPPPDGTPMCQYVTVEGDDGIHDITLDQMSDCRLLLLEAADLAGLTCATPP